MVPFDSPHTISY